MVIHSIKIGTRTLLWCVVVALMITALCFSASHVSDGRPLETLADGSDNAKRIAFLSSYGWRIREEAIEIRDVVIPLEFGDVYRHYNEIQRAQNCDLEPYRGKVVRRYSYEVLNYPDADVPVRANLLLYEDEIIGGDICSVRLDGFMHGFAPVNEE